MGKRYLITGGAGFIGSAMVRKLVRDPNNRILNVDKLTYASNLSSLNPVNGLDNYKFYQIDICNFNEIKKIIEDFKPEIIINFAAESHVDRSIFSAQEFIDSNIFGTYNLLELCRFSNKKKEIIFHQISTDEVYGDIENNPSSTENDPYKPSSPYSATKASADHLVRAWSRTYKIPIFITNCSNNYGPFQNKEKLIPKVITNILNNIDIPLYGSGEQIRDWIYVDDHIEGILQVHRKGTFGETYNIGGDNEIRNIDLIIKIIELINKIKKGSDKDLKNMKKLIVHVEDRLGHDKRYSINCEKIKSIGWKTKGIFENNLEKTIQWYLNEK